MSTDDYYSKSNTGGAIASRGFSYQDKCTLIELFQIVDNQDFKAISVETIDDFTLFIGSKEILYQVKKMQFDIKVVNDGLQKNQDKEQRFIFTSKNSVNYNGLFDKVDEYRESEKSSRNTSEKEKIKVQVISLIEEKKIANAELYLNSQILIYEDSNIDDILYSKFIKWLDRQEFIINNKVDFLNKLRLKISDKKDHRGELNLEEFNLIVENYKTSSNENFLSDNEIKNSSEMLVLKALLKDMPIEKLKIKAYKVLPINYFASLPDTLDGIIDRLLKISVVKDSCVPIITLFENHPDKVVIDFVSYLKRVKFSHIKKFSCSENMEVEELSLLINISRQDGSDKFKIETWRYANNETHRIFDEILEIDLDNNIELNSFLDKVYNYLEEARNVYKSSLIIELILPNERVYQSFKSWGSSKGMSMIRKYQYVHRLQSRFLQPDDNWKNKWESLEGERINIVQHTKFIEGFSYNNELSDANYKVVLKEKIENENLLFSDIEEFGIPILLSSLSAECNVKDIKDFEFKNCQEKICTHIMDNHNNEKSDIFFMVDNPNKIPNEFKNPEQNLYDW